MPKPGGTTARGYGSAHREVRAWWKPIVEQGAAQCHAIDCLEPTRWIQPWAQWDLGHNEARTAWTGPEHVRCNRTEGALRRQGKIRLGTPRRRWVL